MAPAERIRQLLEQKPGLKARQIAEELGLERAMVSTALHRLEPGAVTQDSAYRWWPKAPALPPPDTTAEPRGLLARVCHYYLECLARESGPLISLPADSADYAPLPALPFDANGALAEDRAVRKIVQKARRERGQLQLYVGYPVRLRPDGRIEPVLLYPLEDAELRPAGAVPLFNLAILKNLPAADSGNVMDEAIHLSEELGLANAEEELPPWDEIILRLRYCRPEWDWREDLDPRALSTGAPLSALQEPGIYNRAILLAGTRSPFTYGLELELRKLSQLDAEAIAGTALEFWLEGGAAGGLPPEQRPLLEPLPLNTEQRQAVLQGLSAPLTVVTGPPGTGKSQVVIALLANHAWQGGSVLFSSKNNHAVDVVESRVNELGPAPVLLRVGKEEHQARLAQHLGAALAESAGPGEAAGYAWLARAHEESRARFAAVQDQVAAVAALRNQVDECERAAEAARNGLGPERFSAAPEFDVEGARRRLETLASRPAAARLVSAALRPGRLAEADRLLRADAAWLGLAIPTDDDRDTFRRELALRLEWIERAQAYWQALDHLRQAPTLERLAVEMSRAAEDAARNSLELWRRWLRLWPARWNPEQRKLLAEYVALLQVIAGGDRREESAGRQVFRRYYQLFPAVARLLPCWAVTSLSARGRLPFEPACFDLVVIDEASQCDIASALPLLYRARRAVIIGDPLQLKHVSAVAPQQDRLMLAAHGLAEGRAAWAYSVNSLFDLARSLCRHEDLVNLRDHHRSHRDIINFSNRHFYRGNLRVATNHDALKRPRGSGPAVRWVDLRGKVVRPSRGGALNPAEAERVVEEVRQLVLVEAYEGTLGVVTPFRAQANRIRTLVHQDAGLAERLGAMHFVVDTVHGFQGDERDLMVFSPVVSRGVAESTLGFLKRHPNLFNVAVTRARSELVVVGDRQAALESGVGYLAGFAEYTHALSTRPGTPAGTPQLGPEYPTVTHPDRVSVWERTFYHALYSAGLRPVPQYQEAPYTLDFALFAGGRKLDIEVDGENYHRNWDGELTRRDQIRSRCLNDQGWDIMRFWVYEIRDDLAASVARVQAWAAGECRT